MINRNGLALCLAAQVILIVGCGGSSELAESSGVVTIDGKPLDDAIVTFKLKDSTVRSAPFKSQGKTDAGGSFRLTTLIAGSRRDGAIVGTHYATVSDRTDEGRSARFAKVLLDSDDYVVRSGGPNSFNIEISSDRLRSPNPLLDD